MPGSDLTRLTISWSKETDLELRTYLGSQGLKKGDLSRFIEDAVRWRPFDRTATAIKARHADAGRGTLMEMIDATVRDTRRERAELREGSGAQADPMRVVPDTNILISVLIVPDVEGECLG